jgi:hypothetical protein
MAFVRVLIGIVVGFGLAFGFCYVILHLGLHVGSGAALVVSVICGAIGGTYSAIAIGRGIYGFGPFSIIGYVLDMTWSLLNTTVSLLVWLPACMVGGGAFVEPDERSRRSGTFVYAENPRGGGYDATTVGTVIGGGWSSHEEVHVWQARLFGPLYLPVYVTSLLLNLLFRLCVGKLENIVEQAYYRVCFEDWAYTAGSSSGDTINPGMWLIWFLLSLVYMGLLVLIIVGAILGSALIIIPAALGLIAYNIIRSLTPTNGG